MPASREKQPDQKRIVASLAAECHVPIDDVAAIYEHERAKLASVAHVAKFLHIFVTRNVLETLRKRDPASPPAKLQGPLQLAI